MTVCHRRLLHELLDLDVLAGELGTLLQLSPGTGPSCNACLADALLCLHNPFLYLFTFNKQLVNADSILDSSVWNYSVKLASNKPLNTSTALLLQSSSLHSNVADTC